MTWGRQRRRGFWAPILLAALWAGLVVAAASGAGRREASPPGALPLDLAYARRDFLPFEGPVVSPDGTRVAFTVREPPEAASLARPFLASGAPNWALGARILIAGGPDREPRRVGPESANCWRPSWSPDGRLLAFFSDREGFPQLWVHDVEAGSARALSDARIKPKQWSGDRVRWAPDGRTLYASLDPAAAAATAVPPPAPREAGGDASAVAVLVHRSGSEAGPPPVGPAEPPPAAFFQRRHGAILGAIDVASGEARPIVGAEADPTPSVARLSSSGRWLGYFSVFRLARPGPPPLVHDLAVAAVADGRTWTLARDLPVPLFDYFSGNYSFHPSEDRLVFVRDGGLWHVDLGGEVPGEPRRLGGELPTVAETPLAFTRDGRAVLVGLDPVDDHDGRGPRPRELCLVPLDGTAPRRFPLPEASKLRDVLLADETTLWQPRGGSVTLSLEEASSGESLVARLRLADGTVEPLWRGRARWRSFAAAGRHQRIVGQYQDAGTPPSLVEVDASFSGVRTLALVEPRLAGVASVRAEILETVVPGPSGELRTVRTTLLLPASAPRGRSLPAVVVIYPGPDLSAWASRFGGGDLTTIPNLVFTSRGYAVLVPQLPLTPEGEAGEPIRETLEALLPQVLLATQLGYVDPDRLALVGHSYGAYGAAGVVARSQLFRAAVAISGTYDLGGSYGGMSDEGTDATAAFEHGQFRMGSPPWKDRRRYLANSPYWELDGIRTPLLLIHGDADPDVAESKKLFSGLRRLGSDVQLAIYPGQGHGLGTWERASAVDAVERVLAFLERHLEERREP